MKKIIALLVVAFCLVACNSVDQKLNKLEKACEAQNLEKAEAILSSIDKAELTTEQAARWTEAAMKVSAMKTKKMLEEAGEQIKDAVEDAGEKVEEALEDVSPETKMVIDQAQ